MLSLYKYKPCRVYNIQGDYLTYGMAIIKQDTDEIINVIDHTAKIRFNCLNFNIEVL